MLRLSVRIREFAYRRIKHVIAAVLLPTPQPARLREKRKRKATVRRKRRWRRRGLERLEWAIA